MRNIGISERIESAPSKAGSASMLTAGRLACLVALNLLFVAVGFLLISQRTFAGQDFGVHNDLTHRLLHHAKYAFAFDKTNPPMLYIIGAAFIRLFGEEQYARACACFFLLLNTISLNFLFLIARRMSQSFLAAFTGTTLLAFLPVTLITSVVYASDALAVLPCMLILWTSIKLLEGKEQKISVVHSAIFGFSLAFAAYVKYTFIAFLPLSIGLFLYLLKLRKLQGKNLLVALTLIVLIPGTVLAVARIKNSHHSVHSLVFSRPEVSMTLTSLTTLKDRDVDLLQAPSYGEPVLDGHGKQAVDAGGRRAFKLLVNNKYSYPALLHLAIHSDPLNLANNGLDGWGVNRSKTNQLLQQISTVLGVPGSILIALSILLLPFRLMRMEKDARAVLVCVALVSLSFYLLIVCFFPFVPDVYYGGYWLPRLVLPSILLFGLIAIAQTESLLLAVKAKAPAWGAFLTGLICVWIGATTLVHILLLWQPV